MSALSTIGLSKRFGDRRGIEDCTVELPEGKVVALVGANGAGKSTFLALAAGLVEPSSGAVRVFGDRVRGRIHPDAAYLSQRRPLYGNFTVAEMVRAAAKMNRRWSQERVEEAVAAFGGLDVGARVDSLSLGMRSKLALALCLGRLPRLLLLDEPLADLDPLARDETIRLVMGDVADRGMTVVISSHLLGELREVCDHLLLLQGGGVELDGDVDELLEEHRDLVGPADAGPPEAGTVVHARKSGRQQRMLVRDPGVLAPGWESQQLDLESLVTGYLRADRVLQCP
ncbi:ATP-binding cassette domain-containing protein [Saccharopolyspora sp. ASAGF58]|uniref:ATP-binding cassette domain-containing protein n=1 Tax=Saccharopolyspora sp. ASAGF58 TaxID=2719023 RepID=UPI00144002C5|nr:ABC transporter ATP-binding protein [Saccharopolyspora sp. ASAGF58]QIZ35027.1 ABC transporter ATP-binding protein [Saccharopolyspora sp. ASAGF58]